MEDNLKILISKVEEQRGREPEKPAWGSLDEAGFSRVLGHIGQRGFAIITAFRGEFDLATNRKRNNSLLGTLNSMKMGPILMTGHWDEAPAGMDWDAARKQNLTKDVVEESYFVPCPATMTQEHFEAAMHALGNSFNQDGVLVGSDGNAFILLKDGSKVKAGGLNVGGIAQAYTTMRKRPGRRFTFEGTARPAGAISAQVFKAIGLRYVGDTGIMG